MVNTNKIYKILKSITMAIFIFYAIKTCAHAETLTKLDKAYTNEQVMTYLLDNITIYTNKPVYGTTWATFRNNWETELDNVVFFYYYNNNASASHARTAEFYYGNISYNTTSYNAPNTNNLTLIRGSVLNNLGNNDGQAYFSNYTNQSAQWGSNINNNYLKFYLYKDDNGDWWEYTNDNNISLENIQTGLDFELASTKSITNYQNDGRYWYFQYQYNNSQWLLGWFSNANEFSEVEFQLRESDTDIVISSVFATQTFATNGMFINNGQLFIDNYKIYLNQRYKLEYTCWKDGEIVDSLYFPIVFMQRNAVITNGEVTTIGSGDNYNVQNSTNEILDSSNVDNEFNNFLSGDLSATLGYNDYDNPYQDIIFGLAYNICDVLLADGDVYFDYSMHGENPTRIYASSFTTPENALKSFIRLSMVFGVLFVIYSQFKEIIEAISTARAPNVLHDIDADVYFYKM